MLILMLVLDIAVVFPEIRIFGTWGHLEKKTESRRKKENEHRNAIEEETKEM